ncbi:MAG TPA: 2-oxoacid:acceptor oxidoreductase subunit alpha [Thermodesulfovibrionales bacterium]|nr:2-oxoacid:acceptor oxidoreductase subunit alpha [Thermodesulfovibrionales bacterium]
MDYTIRICGEAGQGIQTVGDTLARVFARTGYHVFTHQDYESRIRGGHNYYQVRVAARPITASRDGIDILVALDRESMVLDAKEVTAAGRIMYDSSAIKEKFDGPAILDIPFTKLAEEHGGSRIMANTVAIGAVLGMLGLSLDILAGIIADTFQKKGEDVIRANNASAAAGHGFAVGNCRDCSFPIARGAEPKMLIAGIDAIGFGAVASGCKFLSAYPMTPSTGIMNYLAAKEIEFGIMVEQAEDAIAAVNMALGASFGGVRSMTATSGGGFALMVEGLSLAAMTETPIVIGLGQRPGPATGLPTRTEQAELQFALYTAHGEFPRIILAPGTPEQAFFLTNKAFDLTEKYQVPAFIIFDQYLADTQWTYEGLDLKKLVRNDYRLRADALAGLSEYKRHAFSESGVSPLAIPGASRHVVVTDSDEHDEEGHIDEDAAIRKKMVEKRMMKKLPLIRQEIMPPLLYGSDKPDVILVGWGSTFGIIKEAVDELSPRNNIAMLHFSEIYPFPQTDRFDYLSVLNRAAKTICIENNATGQFARLMRAETGYVFTSEIQRYDGRPFTLDGLLGEVHAHIG